MLPPSLQHAQALPSLLHSSISPLSFPGCLAPTPTSLPLSLPPSPSSLQVHFAEEWNELHHLQIMESLGGDLRWVDRFLGEHAAVMYYWVLVVIFMISPAASYQFMEMVEVGGWVGGWVGGRASGWVGGCSVPG